MDRATALKQLPAVYASALQLREQGVDNNGVAERLGIPAESIPALFRIAEAKLIEIWRPLGKGFDGSGDSPGSRDGDVQAS